MSAVSKKLTPCSSAASTTARAPSASTLRPNVLHSRPTTDTTSPELPSLRYLMCRPYRRARYPRSVTATEDILQRAADGSRISPEEALLLYTDAPFHALGEAADAVRRRRYPDGIVTYIIDRNINYTNVCVTACKFCAFYRAPRHEEGWSHSMAEILRRCGEAVELGATQIMFQGGHSPDLGIEWYERIFAAIKREYPSLVLHSLGGSEVVHISRTSGLDFETVIRRLNAAGLDSFAGAGAEILVKRPRTAIAPLKESG